MRHPLFALRDVTLGGNVEVGLAGIVRLPRWGVIVKGRASIWYQLYRTAAVVPGGFHIRGPASSVRQGTDVGLVLS